MFKAPHEEITRSINGAAMAVLNALKPGLDEKLYENALIIKLAERGLSAQQQCQFPVHCKGRFIGKLIPDLIVENKDFVDAKVATEIRSSHIAQMIGYLTITEMDVGLVLNFYHQTLGVKRVLNRHKIRLPEDPEPIDLH